MIVSYREVPADSRPYWLVDNPPYRLNHSPNNKHINDVFHNYKHI